MGGHEADAPETVYATAGLVEALLDRARAADPEPANVVLDATPAGAFDEKLGIDDDRPVLTHLYLPEAGGSVRAVFGIDLGRPAGRGTARFVSHPQGPSALTREDDLAAVVLVAVPPWEVESLDAFARSGRRLSLTILDAEPPVESL
ncbi:MAG: hypothetical protein ABEJ43_08290 [Haloferacaceae archaeon]